MFQTRNQRPDAETLYQEYEGKIMAYLRSQITNVQDAEDLHSEIFEKAIRNLDTYDPAKASVSTWIYTIARNRLTDYFRTRRVHTELTEEIEDAEDPFQDIYEQETLEELAAALEALPDQEKDLIVLCYYDKMTLRDVAPMMNLTYGQIKRIHRNALLHLKEILLKGGNFVLLKAARNAGVD